MKKTTLFLFLVLVTTASFPQEIYDLSRCISTGLERNFSILLAKNKETIADNNYTPGNAGYLPSLDLSSRYGGTLNNTKQEAGDGTVNNTSGIHNTSGNASVALGWTLFQGFTVRTTYRKLAELKSLGELNTRMSLEDLAADIASEYYYYVQQIQLYKNLKYAVDLSRERVRIDEDRYLLGSGSKLQLLQSMVYLNADSSRLSKQNEVLRASQVRLNELLASSDLGENIIIIDSVIHINKALEFEPLLNQTIENNTSLLIAGSNQVISEYDYKIIGARSYPYLNFTSGYGYSFNVYEAGNLKNQQVHGMNYGLTMGMDLFDGYNRRREKRNALIEVENKQHQYQQVEQQVRADLITIYYAYTNNLRLLRLEEQNLMTARENLDIALERYKLGNLSGLELREVQKSLLDAEERLLSVQYQTKLAEISLLQIAGQVLEYL